MNIMPTGRNNNNNAEGIGGQEEEELERVRVPLVAVDEAEDGMGGQQAAAASRASLVAVEEEDEGEEAGDVDVTVEDVEDEIHPEPLDCLYGRGKAIYFHPGNIRMLEIVKQYKREYQQSDRKDKYTLIQEVIEEIRDPSLMIESASEDSGNGIRFLAQENGKWSIASEDEVYKKVRNALRDKKMRKGKSTTTTANKTQKNQKKRPRTETTDGGGRHDTIQEEEEEEEVGNDDHNRETRDGELEETSSHNSFYTSSSHSSSSTRDSNNSKDKKPAASDVNANSASGEEAAAVAVEGEEISSAMKTKAPSASYKKKSVERDQTGTAMCRGFMTMMRIDEENPPLSYHHGADGRNNNLPLFNQDVLPQYYHYYHHHQSSDARYPTNISNGTIMRNTSTAAAAARHPFEYSNAFEPPLPLNDGIPYNNMAGRHQHQHQHQHHHHGSYSHPNEIMSRTKKTTNIKGSIKNNDGGGHGVPQNHQVVRFDYNTNIATTDGDGNVDDGDEDDCEPLPLSTVEDDKPYSKAT